MKNKNFLLTLLLCLLPSGMRAEGYQDGNRNDTTVVARQASGRPLPMKWEGPEEEKIYFFSGFAVSADVAGLVMKAVASKFSQIEIATRLNIREKVFPIFELGVAECTRVGNSKDNEFHTTAPYFRVGVDVNANKKRTSNRLMVGLRYGYSSFDYNFTGPALRDPVWKEELPLQMKGIQANAMWAEAAVGFETKIWSFLRLGWNARYKFRISQKHYEYGQPWYIPGYGPNGGNCWGGTVNVIFDFGRTMKKGK